MKTGVTGIGMRKTGVTGKTTGLITVTIGTTKTGVTGLMRIGTTTTIHYMETGTTGIGTMKTGATGKMTGLMTETFGTTKIGETGKTTGTGMISHGIA